MTGPWSNTDHITQQDMDEHNASRKLRQLQRRIYELKSGRQPQVKKYWASDDMEVIDILEAIIDGRMDEDEDD